MVIFEEQGVSRWISSLLSEVKEGWHSKSSGVACCEDGA